MASMLNAHPRIACGPETYVYGRMGMADAERFAADPAWPRLALDFLAPSDRTPIGKLLERYGVTVDEARDVLERSVPSARALLEAVTIPFMAKQSKVRWAEKSPKHLQRARLMRRLWPDAFFIRMVRDPRGAAASLMKTPFGPSAPVASAYRWAMIDERTRGFYENDARSLTVRFEDVLADPEASLRAVCAFIQEEFDFRMLAPGQAARNLIRNEERRFNDLIGAPLERSKVDEWRELIDEVDQRRIAVIAADGLRRYGYEGAIDRVGTAWLHPFDHAMLREPPAVAFLGRAADAGVVFTSTKGSSDGLVARLLYGGPGELRWRSFTSGGPPRAVLRALGSLMAGRMRRRPYLWVEARGIRRRRVALAERLMDRLGGRLARRVDEATAIRELRPPVGSGKARTNGAPAWRR
jgi:hypothetical protein